MSESKDSAEIMNVKKIILAILSTVFPLIMLATDYYVAITDLNVRTGAGQGYAVSYTLQKGDEVEVLSVDDWYWYKIQYAGKIGYVRSKYLQFSRTTTKFEPVSSQPANSFPVIEVCSLLALILVLVFLLKRKKPTFSTRPLREPARGTSSERALVFALVRYGIPEQRIFHDLYMAKSQGHFSQIDLVAITDAGIIVFEVKD